MGRFTDPTMSNTYENSITDTDIITPKQPGIPVANYNFYSSLKEGMDCDLLTYILEMCPAFLVMPFSPKMWSGPNPTTS